LLELGFAASIAAIWLHDTTFGDATPWDDGTVGAYLLTFGIAGALLVIAAAARPSAGWTRRACGVSLLLCGSYLFLPVSFAPDHLDKLGAGAWLGVCGGLVSLLGLLGFDRAGARTLMKPPALRGAPSFTQQIGRSLGLGGAGLILAAIWLVALDYLGFRRSYWDYFFAPGHSVGYFMLVGSCLAVLAIAKHGTRKRIRSPSGSHACCLDSS
jgi:hypothetical protein